MTEWTDENGEVCRACSVKKTLVMVGVMLLGAASMVLFVILVLQWMGFLE
jgi:hypothetical protein